MGLNDLDITKNIRTIEWLKSELLNSIAALFSLLVKGAKETTGEVISSCISNIIIMSYLLAKRLGYTFIQIDIDVAQKLETGINEGHEVEKSYNDLSQLLKHFGIRKADKAPEI